MQFTKEYFIQEFKKRLNEGYAVDIKQASNFELYQTLASIVRSGYNNAWHQNIKNNAREGNKQAYYFSIEFLPGRLLQSNLLNMGWYDTVISGLKDLDIDFYEVTEIEKDMALGNGGLGRLAAAFMDALASSGLPGNGNGIRYKYGLFKQKIVDGYQVELPNEWLNQGNSWEVRRDSKAVDIHINATEVSLLEKDGHLVPVYHGGKVIRAVPYDVGVVGFQNGCVNNLRLWDAEIPESEEVNYRTLDERRKIEDLTSILYPDDSTSEGRRLRLLQEYFFVSAGIQSILKHHKKAGHNLNKLADYVAIHINDTHPVLCIPELMRLLLDEEHYGWDEAWEITTQVMSYTNHTLMAEAMEKWPIHYIQELQPRIYQIICEIERRYVESLEKRGQAELIPSTRIIADNQIRMVSLAIIGSHSVNGVAKLHTELMKSQVLNDFYRLFPERFNNKTNGITERRWLQIANRELSKVLDKTIGKTWRYAADDLEMLLKYQDDEKVLKEINHAKYQNKVRLAEHVKKSNGLKISPDAIFDVQIKRLHEYKRQLLNLLRIIKLYQDLKENPNLDIQPRVFIFGAKAAPGYHEAKVIIKCINEVGNLINNDQTIQDKLKVVFIEDYSVSLAELIIPAADVSEQISTATKEASGTSNMKLMLNGALTVATLDGANIEIKDQVGDDNIFIFGLTKDEVTAHNQTQDYCAWDYYNNIPVIKRVLDALIDGSIPNIQVEGRHVFDLLTRFNDQFFVLADFEGYLAIQEQVDQAYRKPLAWAKMSLINIAKGGHFSADKTVQRYAKEIWHIKPVVEKDEAKYDSYQV
ncbi:glycogen/starch/alpha-glucan phosphorylase [Ligilactobacillus ceti]|uniref:Alpha-1,4 glucan phosphorylase n=1 Tax=Ligilactobacillus ceti DSM 22408 TaxID=1122146 RepID=A0A0R2KUP9_9LACO|nr:glycogen/starch/alpha-glucan phosphorylase [Ligilactobacillus ceti]KRN89988.1 glycogen phosphorylase [Ligilactobacillus ceti DSM 22408]